MWKRSPLLVFVFSIFACLVMGSKALADSPVEKQLAKEKMIRVYVDDSPGYGNQTAGYNIVQWLRQHGFDREKGLIEFYYAKATTDKIVTLFDLPKNIPDQYHDTQKNMTFIKMPTFWQLRQQGKIEHVNLGIAVTTGGPCSMMHADGLPIEDSDPLCDNSADFYNTEVFVEMDPYMSKTRETAISKHGNPHSIRQPGSGLKFYHFPVASFFDAEQYLQNDPRGQQLAIQKPALLPLMHLMTEQKIQVMPVYGYTIQDQQQGNCGMLDHGECFPGNILQIITGARIAQLSTLPRQPLVILIFYDYGKEAKQLLQLIHSQEWGIYEQVGAANARKVIHDLDITNSFSMASLNDSKTLEQLVHLESDDVLLLYTGSLPKIVFDGLYNHVANNILPAVREGASSFNSLLFTGKPHFRCMSDDEYSKAWEIGYDLVSDITLKNQLTQFYTGFCSGLASYNHTPSDDQSFALLVRASQQPNSAISLYFKTLKDEASKPENDRVYYGLDEAIRHL